MIPVATPTRIPSTVSPNPELATVDSQDSIPRCASIRAEIHCVIHTVGLVDCHCR